MLLDKLCRVRSQPGLHIAPDHGPDATESQGEGMPPAGVIIHRETCMRRDDTAGQNCNSSVRVFARAGALEKRHSRAPWLKRCGRG